MRSSGLLASRRSSSSSWARRSPPSPSSSSARGSRASRRATYELDHARERVALDELLGGRAQRALGVEDDLTLVDVDAQDRHAGLPGRGWSESAREARRIAFRVTAPRHAPGRRGDRGGPLSPPRRLAFCHSCTDEPRLERAASMGSPQASAGISPMFCGEVQKEHFFASAGMSLRHSGHFLMLGSGGGSFLYFAIIALIGTTTK